MVFENIEVRPCSVERRVIDQDGRVLVVPADWALLPPGDPALSRRIKQEGPSWTVIEMKGNKRFSRGIWAPASRIELLREALSEERADPSYQRKLEAARERRALEESVYVADYTQAVFAFLGFHVRYTREAKMLARIIAEHATPVGSGTVARTERIPLTERAEASTIAWLRHQTTNYDSMKIAPIKGERSEVRRQLAQESLALLTRYRTGQDTASGRCPLRQALRVEMEERDEL